MIQNFHDRRNVAVKKITYQLETSYKNSDELI